MLTKLSTCLCVKYGSIIEYVDNFGAKTRLLIFPFRINRVIVERYLIVVEATISWAAQVLITRTIPPDAVDVSLPENPHALTQSLSYLN